MRKSSTAKPKKRNPVAKNLNRNKAKVIPNKKKGAKNAFNKAAKPKGGQMDYPTYGA